MLTTLSFNLDTKPNIPPLPPPPPSLRVLSPLWGPSRGGAPPPPPMGAGRLGVEGHLHQQLKATHFGGSGFSSKRLQLRWRCRLLSLRREFDKFSASQS